MQLYSVSLKQISHYLFFLPGLSVLSFSGLVSGGGDFASFPASRIRFPRDTARPQYTIRNASSKVNVVYTADGRRGRQRGHAKHRTATKSSGRRGQCRGNQTTQWSYKSFKITFADQVSQTQKGPASSSLCNAASGQKRTAAQHDDSKRCPFSDPKGSDGFCFLPIFTVRPLLLLFLSSHLCDMYVYLAYR